MGESKIILEEMIAEPGFKSLDKVYIIGNGRSRRVSNYFRDGSKRIKENIVRFEYVLYPM